jgi:hypothetical protein
MPGTFPPGGVFGIPIHAKTRVGFPRKGRPSKNKGRISGLKDLIVSDGKTCGAIVSLLRSQAGCADASGAAPARTSAARTMRWIDIDRDEWRWK